MPTNVGEGLDGDQVQGTGGSGLRIVRGDHPVRRPGRVHPCRRPRAAERALQQVGDGVDEAELGQPLRVGVPDDAAEALPGRGHVLREPVEVVRDVRQHVADLSPRQRESQPGGREHLNGVVVEAGRHATALGVLHLHDLVQERALVLLATPLGGLRAAPVGRVDGHPDGSDHLAVG